MVERPRATASVGQVEVEQARRCGNIQLNAAVASPILK
jgi:hypothetical protein